MRSGTVVSVLVVVAIGCGGGDGDEAVVDHQSELALEESLEVIEHLVPVDGYRYVNVSGSEIEETKAILDRSDEGLGIDLHGAFSLHSVVADDPDENTAYSRRGDREVGFLVLVEFNEPVPPGLEGDVAAASFGAAASDEMTIAGVPVWMFINEARVDSRYNYVWFGDGGELRGVFDGADREPMERWLNAYLGQPGAV